MGDSAVLEPVSLPLVPWDQLDAAPDRTIWQTRAWLDLLAETQGAEPLVARVLVGSDPVGWFTGATIRRAGAKVLGAPLRGWTTPAMGFNLDDATDRATLLQPLARFALRDLGCLHVEVADRALLAEGAAPPGFRVAVLPGFELDLRRSDDELLAAMTAHGRRDVRRALRNGIEVEEVDPTDPGDFVAQYYGQLTEAFAKRAATPTFPIGRVHALVRHLGPTGRLVLLRARTPNGEVAATGIFPGLEGRTAEYWGGASWRSHQPMLPNEALMWTAIRTWRDRGATRLNFGGGGTYKAKYGGAPHRLPSFRCSRPRALEHARTAVQAMDRRRRRTTAGPSSEPVRR